MHPQTTESLCLPFIDLPVPCTVTMLDGSKTFLICNTGTHLAILGLKWLDTHSPEIDWDLRTLSFPHSPLEHIAIAKEEEADKDLLNGVPPVS
ncbi:Retrotransposable element Tf2 protein [Rhizoctonia solani]|uniref:Retrotransposable element Tf2 protein n=1 Tax=Rhizoctonia solani TaxID=456999 RepID=A0A8H8NS62_9AGAM|nr:Retrotransposable element Tf2 protein [Rhizoctonia solani]QRW18520.1 Retrotransposable element Tf2 protein [Rhizoctonia solani]